MINFNLYKPTAERPDFTETSPSVVDSVEGSDDKSQATAEEAIAVQVDEFIALNDNVTQASPDDSAGFQGIAFESNKDSSSSDLSSDPDTQRNSRPRYHPTAVATLSNLRANAELFYISTGYTYTSLCSDTRITTDLGKVLDLLGLSPYKPSIHGLPDSNHTANTAVCRATRDTFIIAAPLAQDSDFWCVDSTGTIAVSYVCPSQMGFSLVRCNTLTSPC